MVYEYLTRKKVTPLAGVWIEIKLQKENEKLIAVTPLAGVWIEILLLLFYIPLAAVTPLAGVWIEIGDQMAQGRGIWSLPLRECGLK